MPVPALIARFAGYTHSDAAEWRKNNTMLRTHKKITKKELKKDPFVLLTAQVIDFLKAEWVKIISTVIAVVLIISVSLLIVNGRKKGELNAYDAAFTALQNNAPEANDLLKKYSSKYSGSDGAAEALIQLGNRAFQQKDLANSEKYYSEFIKKHSKDPILGFNAYNNLGSVYEEKGDFKAAAKTYETYTQKFKDSPFAPVMLLNAGKAHLLAGEKDLARVTFQKINDSYRDSEEKVEALSYLEMMK